MKPKGKYLVIREHNKWERETWRFCFSIDRNDSGLLSSLMLLVKRVGDNRVALYKSLNTRSLCAISTYGVEIMDAENVEKLSKSNSCTYIKACTILSKKISPRKLAGLIRGVNETISGEDFRDPFYKGGIRDVVLRR